MICAATAGDHAAVARLHRELGVVEPPPSLEQWPAISRETLVYTNGDAVLGYVLAYAFDRAGHIHGIVVDAAARGAGAGEALMLAAAARFRALGLAEWHLNVKVDNAPAIRLYEKLGMAVEHRTTVLGLDWSALDRLPHDDATVLPVDPAEDDDIERALHLIGGRLAMTRRRASRRLIQLRDSSCAPVGIAVFDPELGASPFRVARPGLAAPLLAACRPYATKPTLQVVIEDDAALADLLVAAGATVKLRLLHYLGVL